MKKVLWLALSLTVFFPAALRAENFLDHKEVKLGEPVKPFKLPGINGEEIGLSQLKGKIVFIHFWSATCPFVKRYERRLQDIAAAYKSKGVEVIAIDSNANEDLNLIKKIALDRQLNYPILIDKGNKIADEFGAIATPHVFILDKLGRLAYEGAVDNQGWNENDSANKNYAKDALEAMLGGQPVANPQTKTVGCTIKRVESKIQKSKVETNSNSGKPKPSKSL